MGRLKKNQPGYTQGKDKNGRTIWVPDGSQSPNAGSTSGGSQSAVGDFDAPTPYREERSFDNDAALFKEAEDIDSYEELDEFLYHSNPHVRTAALRVQDDELQVHAVGELMGDHDEDVRMAVVESEAMPTSFMRILRNDSSDAVRVLAAERANKNDAELFFNDDNEYVRAAALRHDSNLSVNTRAVADPSPVVRKQAAELGFGNEYLLEDPDSEVRESAEKYKKNVLDEEYSYGYDNNFGSDLYKKNELTNQIRGGALSEGKMKDLVDRHPDEDIELEALKRVGTYDFLSNYKDSPQPKLRDYAREQLSKFNN